MKKPRNEDGFKSKKPFLVKDHTISELGKENKLMRKTETHSK